MTTRLMLVGGFLGAGKTTLLLKSARTLAEQGHRVGLVTNDQGQELVDTVLARQQEIPVAEVAGGCFCCRFPDLLTSIQKLQDTANPDIILAEPVGSCTDLVATILRPLHKYYPDQFQLAPLTILVDPLRESTGFSAEVDYLYHKQLAEANIIALSKIDVIDADTVKAELEALRKAYPSADVVGFSAKTGQGLSQWLERCLMSSSNIANVLDLDYTTYAQAEAGLGWLNAHGALVAEQPFSATEWLTGVFTVLEQELAQRDIAIAHIKSHVIAPPVTLKASMTQLGRPISWDIRSDEAESNKAQFILNARVHTDPETLESLVRHVVATVKPRPDIQHEFTHFECFSPLPPQPTYRITDDTISLTAS